MVTTVPTTTSPIQVSIPHISASQKLIFVVAAASGKLQRPNKPEMRDEKIASMLPRNAFSHLEASQPTYLYNADNRVTESVCVHQEYKSNYLANVTQCMQGDITEITQKYMRRCTKQQQHT